MLSVSLVKKWRSRSEDLVRDGLLQEKSSCMGREGFSEGNSSGRMWNPYFSDVPFTRKSTSDLPGQLLPVTGVCTDGEYTSLSPGHRYESTRVEWAGKE